MPSGHDVKGAYKNGCKLLQTQVCHVSVTASGVLGVYAGIRRTPTSRVFLTAYTHPVVKVVMCSRGGGSASEVETHKNIDSVLHTKTTFQAHSIFSVSIQK